MTPTTHSVHAVVLVLAGVSREALTYALTYPFRWCIEALVFWASMAVIVAWVLLAYRRNTPDPTGARPQNDNAEGDGRSGAER